ncbi:tetratricopeptide repeat-containing sensor histidine kinase [Pedobacter sp. BMA]|uniref:tetratricopeptide repeat-containing sensor histidine kinase n=1 Tax=Pedobacter sp. BMA TaxID=1663685 RepID=UPI00064990C9|nr:tetratricopeptide repeat-containing sensor histidine kinase [Pedobacter sp. BMA]KLT63774.1 hypothetical protein AB669_20225 [Pedobacter sp. BMA]
MVNKNIKQHILFRLTNPLALLLLFCLSFAACKNDRQELYKSSTAVKSILDSASHLLDLGEEAGALNYLEHSTARFDSIAAFDRWQIYNFKAIYYLNYSYNIRFAEIYADSMLHAIEPHQQQYKYEYAVSLFTKGDVLRSSGNFERAYDYYYEAKVFAGKHLNDCSKAVLSFRIGLVRYRQANYSRAITFFKEAITEKNACANRDFNSNVYFPQAVLNATGLSYERINKPDSAIHYYQLALKCIFDNEKSFPAEYKSMIMAQGVIYGNLGGLYAKEGKSAKAEDMLRRSIRLNDHKGFAIDDAQTAKIKLINLYLDKNEFEKARNILDQVDTYLQSTSGPESRNNEILKRWLDAQSQYYHKIGDYKSAFHFLGTLGKFTDSISKAEQAVKRSDFDNGLENAERRYQMLTLERTGERKSLFLYGSIILLILIIIIAFLFIKNLRKDRKNLKAMRILNTQIIHSYEALEESHQENNDMLQVIAHDLRNPISGMMMAASTLSYITPLPVKDQHMYDLIQESGEEAIKMINELLESKTRQLELKLREADIFDILYYCVKMLEHKAAEKSIHINLKAFRVTFLMNREKIWRVFSNLIGNAIKFSMQDKEINIELSYQQNGVAISIADEGVGIPENVAATLFDNRGKIGNAGTHGEPSFGLGLSIARQIVDAHNGKIWFEPNPSGGTTFWVWLPI